MKLSITKEELENLYIVDGLSAARIAVLYHVSEMTVFTALKRFNIPSRKSNISKYQEYRSLDFSTTQQELLIGSVLGDGCLRIPKRGKNAFFSEKHAESQLAYLSWKNNLLKPFTRADLHYEDGKLMSISGRETNVQPSYSLRTISHPYLTKLWTTFYQGNGKKILPQNFIDYLTPLSLAVWFMDDGSLRWKSRYYSFSLHTESFTYQENVRLSDYFSKKYLLNASVIPRFYKNGTRFYLKLSGKENLRSLLNSLISYSPHSMRYKFQTFESSTTTCSSPNKGDDIV